MSSVPLIGSTSQGEHLYFPWANLMVQNPDLYVCSTGDCRPLVGHPTRLEDQVCWFAYNARVGSVVFHDGREGLGEGSLPILLPGYS